MKGNKFKTEQEQFWSGEFGDQYIDRNKKGIENRIRMFKETLPYVLSIYEIGANIGLNLDAIHEFSEDIHLSGLEINNKAYNILKNKKHIEAFLGSFLDPPPIEAELSLSVGVLIHVSPEKLQEAYKHLYESSTKYILIAEYYNPTPVQISYRGHSNKLFKRDFAGEMIDLYNLKLRDYGFFYHRDKSSLDDLNWFLLEK